MAELLSKLSGGETIALVAVLGGFVIAAISTIAHQWRKVRVAEFETLLKQQMLEKGMSAADIEQVLKASKKSDDSGMGLFTASVGAEKSVLIKIMAENEWSGQDIERVIRAFGQYAEQGSCVQGSAIREKAVAVKDMVENGLSAEDIERVLLAFDSHPERVSKC